MEWKRENSQVADYRMKAATVAHRRGIERYRAVSSGIERRRWCGGDQSAGQRVPVVELLRGVALDQDIAVVKGLEVNLDYVGA